MRASVALAVLVLLGLGAASGSDAAMKFYDLQIPQQKLDTALKDFAAQTGMQIARFSDSIDGQILVGPLHGPLSMEEALKSLLMPHGLTYKFVNERTIAVVSARGTDPATRSPSSTEPDPPSSAPAQAPVEGRRPAKPPAGAEAPPGVEPRVRASQETVERVVVTGSRVATSGFAAPTPITMLTADDLAVPNTGTAIDRITQLPMFQNSAVPQTVRVSTTGPAGASLLDLRGLSPTRTLVLLEGRRIVPVNSHGSPDVSIVPQALLERVEVVTGGASAAYGSDAVSGVVNFILDKDFTGLKAAFQQGTSTYEDADNYKVSITGGADFADGRGHIVANLEYYNSEGVQGTRNRPFAQQHCALIGVPESLQPPANTIACDVKSALATYGGLISTGPLRGTAFGPGGVPYPHDFGTLTTQNYTVGGNGVMPGDYINLMAGLERKNVYLHADFDLVEDASVYFEALYGQNISSYNSAIPNAAASRAFTIYRDNAYLPQSVRDAMVANGLTSFRLGRVNLDWVDGVKAGQDSKVYRLVAGVDGELWGDWKYEAYLAHGRNARRISADKNMIYENAYRAVDAVLDPATGRIACHSTLADPSNGCVPMNVFGYGSPSADAIDYVLGKSSGYQTTKQDVLAMQLSGEPFSTWAGSAAFAVGVEHRVDEMWVTSDPMSQSIKSCVNVRGCAPELVGFPGAFQVLNLQPTSGEVQVTEGFVELLLPLARGLPWVKSLNVNGAARYTDYSTSGPVATWKAGFVYEPNNTLRFRATQSRDIRAGNAQELFAGFDESPTIIVDRLLGNTQYGTFVGSIGNPHVEPEKADSTTLGMILSPTWLPSFTASVDYYDIEINGAIGQYTAQQTIDACVQSVQSLCGFITRRDNGQIQTVFLPYLNRHAIETSGFDFELSYVAALPIGSLTTRLLANNIQHKRTIVPGAKPIELAGQVGGAGTPKWRGAVMVGYSAGSFSANLTERVFGGGKRDLSFVEGVDISADDNDTSSILYTDFALRWNVAPAGSDVQVFAAINNLFNQKPPRNSGVTNTTVNLLATNYELYDAVGRTYSVGLRVRL
jgi:outer membrane receptor protein involved in Fe transport